MWEYGCTICPRARGLLGILKLAEDWRPFYQAGLPVSSPITTYGGNDTRKSLKVTIDFKNDYTEEDEAMEATRHEILAYVE